MSWPLGRTPSYSVSRRQPLSLLASSSSSRSLWQYLAFLAPSGLGCVNVSILSQFSVLPADGEPLGLMSHCSAHTWQGPVLSTRPAKFTVLRCAGHELSRTLGTGGRPRLRPGWCVGAGPGLPPLAPTWGLGRERDRLCGPAYPYCFFGDLGPGVSLLSFQVVLRYEFLSRYECLLWVLGKISSWKCKGGKVSTLLLLCLLRPPLSLLDTVTLTHVHTRASGRHSCSLSDLALGQHIPHTVDVTDWTRLLPSPQLRIIWRPCIKSEVGAHLWKAYPCEGRPSPGPLGVHGVIL